MLVDTVIWLFKVAFDVLASLPPSTCGQDGLQSGWTMRESVLSVLP